MCLHKFLLRTPALGGQLESMLREAVSDKHLSVVGAALHGYSLLVTQVRGSTVLGDMDCRSAGVSSACPFIFRIIFLVGVSVMDAAVVL